MITVRKYILIQHLITLCAVLFLIGSTWNNIQYAVLFFPISALLFIAGTYWEWYDLSQYFKEHYPLLYKARNTGRKYYFREVMAIDLWGIKDPDFVEIDNQDIIARIKQIKKAIKTILISMLVVLILIVIRSYVY
jgi:hypothetical protein